MASIDFLPLRKFKSNFWLLAREMFTQHKNFNSPFRPSLFFFQEATKISIQKQAIVSFAQRRVPGKLF